MPKHSEPIEKQSYYTFVRKEVVLHRCCGCGEWFMPGRTDAATCSNKCRNKAARARKKH